MGCCNEREINEKSNKDENIKKKTIEGNNKIIDKENQIQSIVKPKLIRIQSMKKNENFNIDDNNNEKNEVITIKNNNYLYYNNNNNNNNNNENNKEDILTLYH